MRPRVLARVVDSRARAMGSAFSQALGAPAPGRRDVDDATTTRAAVAPPSTPKRRSKTVQMAIEPARATAAPEGWEKTLATIKRWRAEGPSGGGGHDGVRKDRRRPRARAARWTRKSIGGI